MCSEEHDTTRNQTAQMWKPHAKDNAPRFTCSGNCGKILADCSDVYKVLHVRHAINKDGITRVMAAYCHECAKKRGITND